MLRDDGSITGNVSDQTGAALPGATVEVVNTETGVLKSATTDERGAYLLSDLQPGTYSITIQLAGFRPATQKDARLASNAVLRVDARLELAGVLETAEVIGTSPVLQTDRGDIHITQTARQINDLPLTGSAGRNYQMTLVPGAVLAGEQNSAAGSPQRSISFNVNGVSRLQNNTRLDGASIVYPWLPTNTAYVPSAEAIEEVSIATNSFNAEQGLAGGASINVVIKSGTNNVRGTAWGYNSDYDLRAEFLPRAERAQAGRVPEPVRRQPRWSDHEEQAVLLRQLGAHETGEHRAPSGSSASPPTRSAAATSAPLVSRFTIPPRTPTRRCARRSPEMSFRRTGSIRPPWS